MLTYDPRTISSKVYHQLNGLKTITLEQTAQKEQKSQAVELYNYVATWGLLRLKAEEFALSQENKRRVVERFFQTLQEINFPESESNSLTQPPTRPTQQSVQPNQPNRPNQPNPPNRPTQQAVAPHPTNSLIGREGLNYLMTKEASEYLGLTGLALQVAREFAFWAEAVYPKFNN